MTKICSAALGAACIFALSSQGVSAQSLRSIESTGRAELRGMASLTIPLGGIKRSAEAKPRFDLAMETSRIGHNGAQASRWDGRVAVRRTTFSLTLDQQPTMMLNGRALATFGPKLGADEDDEAGGGGGNTALYVVGGLLAFGAIGTVILVTDTRDAVSDLIGPED